MGLCRGLSMRLGATAVSHGDLSLPLMFRGWLDHLTIAVVSVSLYIAAVTHLARFETQQSAPGFTFTKWLPTAAIVGGMITFFPLVGGPNRVPTLALLLLACVVSAHTAWQLSSNPGQPLPPAIGQLIRLLLPIQAAFCAATGDGIGALSAAARHPPVASQSRCRPALLRELTLWTFDVRCSPPRSTAS